MAIVMSLVTVGNFLLYFGAALLALVLFLVLYMAVTTHHEAALIRAGNVAAAISLGGAVLGFALPLASAIVHSVSLLDMAVWGAIALAVQIAVFLAVNLALREVSARIERGDIAAGTTLAVTSLAVGVVNAACISY
ncbi:MAG: DUF350 domain-containing protein [Alphaproteobacteria bacterium]|nr:DUF350 domain-containing protein [Alphaproteobacteria bacterium]